MFIEEVNLFLISRNVWTLLLIVYNEIALQVKVDYFLYIYDRESRGCCLVLYLSLDDDEDFWNDAFAPNNTALFDHDELSFMEPLVDSAAIHGMLTIAIPKKSGNNRFLSC